MPTFFFTTGLADPFRDGTRRFWPVPQPSPEILMNLANLPAIGQPLDTGTFVGVTTTRQGAHCAVVLLEPQPTTRLTWDAAMEWAKSVEGELPSRAVQALLFANARGAFEAAWYWSSEPDEDDGSFAWFQDFYYGTQGITRKSYEGRARAVRLIPLTA
jgi:hypothetical protein